MARVLLRGGRADSHFPGLKTGDQVIAMPRASLQNVIDTLRNASREVSDKLDLYDTSEPRIMQVLARAKLIRNGFDATELQNSFMRGDLLKRLMA